jgi:hypothetical protein
MELGVPASATVRETSAAVVRLPTVGESSPAAEQPATNNSATSNDPVLVDATDSKAGDWCIQAHGGFAVGGAGREVEVGGGQPLLLVVPGDGASMAVLKHMEDLSAAGKRAARQRLASHAIHITARDWL